MSDIEKLPYYTDHNPTLRVGTWSVRFEKLCFSNPPTLLRKLRRPGHAMNASENQRFLEVQKSSISVTFGIMAFMAQTVNFSISPKNNKLFK